LFEEDLLNSIPANFVPIGQVVSEKKLKYVKPNTGK
jgi:hypothetical protein